MNTIIVGTVKKINKVQTFTNEKTKKEFNKCEVIIDQNKNYKSALCIEFHQDNIDLTKQLTLEHVYEFHINASSNEWNNKYYTSIDCWKIQKLDQAKVYSYERKFSQETEKELNPVGEETDLPF